MKFVLLVPHLTNDHIMPRGCAIEIWLRRYCC